MINPPSQIVNFFKELLHRLETKSPKFFAVLQIFGASLTLAGYIPKMLDRWVGVHSSEYFINFCTDISQYATGFFLATLFAAESKPVAVTDKGSVIKKLEEDKYPFTTKVEQKKAEKAEVPVVTDPMDKPKDS